MSNQPKGKQKRDEVHTPQGKDKSQNNVSNNQEPNEEDVSNQQVSMNRSQNKSKAGLSPNQSDNQTDQKKKSPNDRSKQQNQQQPPVQQSPLQHPPKKKEQQQPPKEQNPQAQSQSLNQNPDQVMSTRSYLEQTVASVVQEGMIELAKNRPPNPLEFLGNFILDKARAMNK